MKINIVAGSKPQPRMTLFFLRMCFFTYITCHCFHQKMRNIRNTNKEEIKKELEKQGVKVSGKSDRLLKDIYLYSKVCNINITHEA